MVIACDVHTWAPLIIRLLQLRRYVQSAIQQLCTEITEKNNFILIF